MHCEVGDEKKNGILGEGVGDVLVVVECLKY